MSARMKALAVLNVLGWVIVVPLLLLVVVDPFVDFGDWPDRLIGGRDGEVRLHAPAHRATTGAKARPRTPAAPAARPSADDPLRAAREAIARFRPATRAPVASGGLVVAGSLGTGSASGGSASGSGGGPGATLRGLTGPQQVSVGAGAPTGDAAPLEAGGVTPAASGPVVSVPGAGAAGTAPIAAPDVPQTAPSRPARATDPPPPERPGEAAPPRDPAGPGPRPTPTPQPSATPEPPAPPQP